MKVDISGINRTLKISVHKLQASPRVGETRVDRWVVRTRNGKAQVAGPTLPIALARLFAQIRTRF